MCVFTTQTVAKTTSLFTEQSSGPEIQRLIGEVNGDLQRMTTELDALQRDVQARGGSARSQDADHHKNVVSYLKAQVGETTAAFKDVLQTRTTVCSAFPSKVLFLQMLLHLIMNKTELESTGGKKAEHPSDARAAAGRRGATRIEPAVRRNGICGSA